MMANQQFDLNSERELITHIESYLAELVATSETIHGVFTDSGGGWKDSKFTELGECLGDITKQLLDIYDALDTYRTELEARISELAGD